MTDPDVNTRKIFISRISLTFPAPKSEEEYISKLSGFLKISNQDIEDYLANNRWFLSCFMLFDREFYQSDEWEKYCKDCLLLNTWCDETVFLTYGWTHKMSFKDLTEIHKRIRVVYAPMVKKFVNHKASAENLGIMHPLHGDYCHDKSLTEVYRKILND